MRSRDRILANLEAIYRESYDRARTEGADARMVDLDNAYMRDQLMLEQYDRVCVEACLWLIMF